MQKRTLILIGIILLLVISNVMNNKVLSAVLVPLPQSSSSYNITTHSNLTDSTYSANIEHFFENGSVQFFQGKENISIYTNSFLHTTITIDTTTDSLAQLIYDTVRTVGPSIVISSGRTEAAVKYKELIFDLYNNGYSVFILDHRGQGLSGRMTEDTTMGYIDSFSYYIDDMKLFYDSIVLPNNPTTLFLLAHSLGGAIATDYLETYPNDFTAAALSSPMLGLPFPTCLGICIFVKDTPNYAPGMKPYSEYDTTFENTKLTTDELRLSRMNRAFDAAPTAVLGGASAQWVYRSCKEFKKIKEHISSIQTPLILFSSEQEKIVATKAHKKFIRILQKEGKAATGYEVPGAKHELLIEQDSIRVPVITTILDFFKSFSTTN